MRTRSVNYRSTINKLNMKTEVPVLIIWVLKPCYGFLKLSSYSKKSELEFDKPLEGIVLPRRHESWVPAHPQRVEKRLNCSLFVLYLSYASGFCGYFLECKKDLSLFHPFCLLTCLWVFAWIEFWPFFEVLPTGHYEEQGMERCSDILTYPHIPSLGGGLNWWMNSWEKNKVCWIHLDNINMFYFFR